MVLRRSGRVADLKRIYMARDGEDGHLVSAQVSYSIRAYFADGRRLLLGDGIRGREVAHDLARLFRDEADERWAKRIAGRLADRRDERPFERTGDLAQAVGAAIPRKAWPPKIHPATRVFLALRVEVNQETQALRRGLDAGLAALSEKGRMAVLTFQSHEDRTVKRLFREWDQVGYTD